ncbi:MAG: hypothetical protein E6J02_02020 [Chloroflexi bacterium]|nr:MAG: hypothetical protein E6J02_02020 [Chloroflexota bacterium]TME16311.1 MAG: hypothetical protein E6I63_06725 [Chloroflexota bacterium]TME19051.1 MAG: hypothetical protein E6I70_05180 [Chloroflexota bacterium]
MRSAEDVFPNRIVGVIRSGDSSAAFRACLAAIEGGVGSLEVTTGVPEWPDLVRGLRASTGRPVGAGTVLTVEHVLQAARAGAAFVVTPVVIPEVARAAREQDILCVMGALTPTEIYQALQVAKADVVKLFPIAAVGGPAYLKYLAGPMPDIPIWVSGGVEIDQVTDYLKLGVTAIGLTTALFPPDAVARGEFDVIKRLAREAASALAGVA